MDGFGFALGRSPDFGSPPQRDPHVDDLLQRNATWREERIARDPDYFAKLSEPQHPHYLYFGCSDSRVVPNAMLGLPPRELFVHRNVGNLLSVGDPSATAVLAFALNVLKVSHILVCGHYDCGAVRAASEVHDHGLVESWICPIRETRHQHRQHLSQLPEDERHKQLVELNVMQQCLNLFKTALVQHKLAEGRAKGLREDQLTPKVHAMVFDPATGELKWLPINFQEKRQEMEAFRLL